MEVATLNYAIVMKLRHYNLYKAKIQINIDKYYK